MGMDQYESLKLDNQLCFPLYAVSRQIVRSYTPYLKKLDLTYTQYITLMVLWEEGSVPIRKLTQRLHLDTGTMTPLLRKMEENGLVTRTRSKEDERVVMISLTEKGWDLREEAVKIPAQMTKCMTLSPEDTKELYRILHLLLE